MKPQRNLALPRAQPLELFEQRVGVSHQQRSLDKDAVSILEVPSRKGAPARDPGLGHGKVVVVKDDDSR